MAKSNRELLITLGADTTKFQQRIKRAKDLTKELDSNFKLLSSSSKNFESSLDGLAQKCKYLEERIQVANTATDEYNRRLKEQQEMLNNAKSKFDMIQNELKEMEECQKRSTDAAEWQQWQTEIDKSKQELEQVTNEMRTFQNAIISTNTAFNKNQTELQKMNSELAETKTKMSMLNRDKVFKEMSTEISEADRKFDNAKNSVATFGNSISHLTMQKQHLTSQLQKTKTLMKEYQTDITKSTAEMQKMEQKSKILTAQIRQLETTLHGMDGTEKNYKELSDELERLRARLTRVNSSMELHKNRVNELTPTYNMCESKLNSMEGELKQVDIELRQVGNKNNFKKLERDIESSRQKFELLESQIEALKSGFVNFENSIKGNKEATKLLKQQVESLGQEYKEQQSLITAYDAKLKSLEKELEQVTTSIKETKLAMSTMTNDTAGVQKQLLKLGELEQKYDSLEHEIDEVTNSLRQTQIQANSTLTQMNNSVVAQTGTWTALSNKMMSIGAAMQTIGGKIRAVGGALTPLTMATTALGTGIIKTGANFEESMSKVKAVTGATDTEMQQLTTTARQLGKDTTFSALEASEGLQYLGLAGYSAKDSMAALPLILDAAKAGSIQLATCSDLATDALASLGDNSEFTGDKIGDLKEMLNQAAQASTNSNSSMEQLLNAYIKVGGQIDAMNIPMSTANTMFAILADRGVKSTEAGTSLNSILINLTKTSGQSADAMKKLGFSAFDTATGKIKPMEKLLGDLKKSLKGLSTEQQEIQLTNMLGGKTQVDTLQKLLKGIDEDTLQFTDHYKQLKKEFQEAVNTDALTKLREEMSNNLKTDFEIMKSTLSEAFLSTYDDLAPKLREIVKTITDTINQLNDNGVLTNIFSQIIDTIQWLVEGFANLSPNMQEAILKFTIIGGAVAPVIMLFGGLVSSIGSIFNGFGGLIGKLVDVKNKFALVKSSGGTLGSVLTGKLGGAVSGVTKLFSGGFLGALKTVASVGLPALGVALTAVGVLFGDNQNFLSMLIDELGVFGKALSGVSEFINGVFTGTIGQVGNVFKGIGKSAKSILKGDFKGLGDIWKNTWNDMESTAIKAGENITMNTTRSISKLRKYTQEDVADIKTTFDNTFKEISKATTSNVNEVGANITKMFADSRNKTVGIAQGSIDILTGTSDTMRQLFANIRSGMDISEAQTNFTNNLERMIKSGDFTAEQIEKDFAAAWNTIDKNIIDGGQRIQKNADNVLKDFGTIASGNIEDGAASIAKALDDLGMKGVESLRGLGTNWNTIFQGISKDGANTTEEMTEQIIKNLGTLELETPEQIAAFKEKLVAELQLAKAEGAAEGGEVGEEVGESINEGIQEGVQSNEAETGEAVKQSAKNSAEKAKDGAVEGFDGLPDEVRTQLEKIGITIDEQGNVIQQDLTEQAAKGAQSYVQTFEQEAQSLSGVADTIKKQLEGIDKVRLGGTTKQLSEINKWLGKVQKSALDTESKMLKFANASFDKSIQGVDKLKSGLEKTEKGAKNVTSKLKEIPKVTFGATTKGLSEVQKWLDRVKNYGDKARSSLSNLSGVRFGGVTSSLSAVVTWLDKVRSRATLAKSAVSQVNTGGRAAVQSPESRTVSEIPVTIANTNLDDYSTSLMRNSANIGNYKTSGGFYQVQDIMKSAVSAANQADAQQSELLSLVLKQNELLMKLLNREKTIEVGVNVDGKQIAKSSAKYMETEINKLYKRKTRLGGIA